MTNRDYLSHTLGALASPETIEALAVGATTPCGCLNLDETADARLCDLAIYNGIHLLLSRAGANVTEGGYSISYNLEALRLLYRAIAARLGRPDRLGGAGRVRYRSF